MFPNDKIIEIFSLCDDFSKNFDGIVQKNRITAGNSGKKSKYYHDGKDVGPRDDDHPDLFP